MSEEFSHIGTVRRRPRTQHQRGRGAGASQPGRDDAEFSANGNGAHKRNGHAKASEPWAGEEPGAARRKTRPKREEPKATSMPLNPELEMEPGFRLPFDPLRLFAAAKRNIVWVLLGGALLGMLGFFLAAFAVDYKVTMGLMRKTSNAMRNEGVQMIDKFQVREYSDQTIYSFMKSRDVLSNVVRKAASNPLIAPLNVTMQQLAEAVTVRPADNPDFVMLSMNAFGGLRSMVELINLYSEEVVSYTRDVQRSEAATINRYLQGQLTLADEKIKELTTRVRGFSQGALGDYGKETELDIKQLIAMRENLLKKRTELDSINKVIEEREIQLGGGRTKGSSRLQIARAELQELKYKYTEANPIVQQKIAEIQMLEKNPPTDDVVLPSAGAGAVNNPVYLLTLDLKSKRPALESEIAETEKAIAQLEKSLGSRANIDIDYTLANAELQSQRAARESLEQRRRESELFMNNALGYFGIVEPATMNSINYKTRWMKVTLLGIVAGFLGIIATLGVVLLTEAFDTSLKTAEDINRVTGLPVLAALGDLRKMSASEQVNWAFRTLTLLKGKLSRNSDQALVCGIMSANHGEGRSTWVNLLVSAASQRGLRVLTVDTRAAAAAPATTEPPREPAPQPASKAAEENAAHAAESTGPIHLPEQMDNAEGGVLSTPGRVTERFEEPHSQSIVHIPLPGWVWSLERRKQWQDALEQWREIDNLVIFVELPPASEPESILLAENVPQLIWLVGSGMADAAETKTHLETIRHARCNLVGAVLNYAPPPLFNTRFARWFQRMTALIVLSGSMVASQAQPERHPELQPAATFALAQNQGGDNAQVRPATAAPNERFAFSAAARRKRAAWQERLTFGPGDVMDIHVYGSPSLSRTNVMVGPDGRISFLQAGGVVASGMTVEELRARLDTELARFYTEAAAPKTIVIPVAFTSKKYYMLGKVNAKGAYILDRPLTLLEAVARAKGLETGLYQRTTVEMADLSHSFLIRNGEKLSVDFERLFQEGDLSQNVLLEPNDYIYFASAAANDIYVLGEVMSPGPIGFVPNATVLTAITDRGGYSERAFKKRVLVVRGSLNEPETFVVDTLGALDARVRDFRLQPRDIVYVSSRPWVQAEELLDEAASSFIQGAVTTWAGVNVGPVITKRLLPRTRPR